MEIKSIYTALAKAQGEFLQINKNCENPFYKNKYADIAEIRRATTPALSANGISVVQIVEPDSDYAIIKTILGHECGTIESVIKIKPTKNDAQGFGSALTYARRYALSAILGVSADDDDDAEICTDKKQPEKQVKKSNLALYGELKSSVAPDKLANFNRVVETYLSTRGGKIEDLTDTEIGKLINHINEVRSGKK